MFDINNEKNKSAVILSPEAGVGISGASVESVVNDGVKTKRYSAKRDLYGDFAYAQPLKMTMISCFALLFNLINISESRAECFAKENFSSVQNCYDTWKPGEANNCGDGCTYTYNNGKLTVTATKPDAVIPEGIFSSRYYDEKADFPNITNIEIAGEFKTIGTHAFLDKGTTISGKNGVLYTNNIKHNAFGNNNTLTGTIIVSDKQTTLGEGPWYAANLNATVILPPTIKSISGMSLSGLNLGPNAKIYCGVENCEELFNEKVCDSLTGGYAQYKTKCKNNLETLLTSGKLLTYPDGCTKMGASGCTKCKNANFKLNDGECDRLRYTPAEAAKVLTDDNNNSVTITFKK